MHKPLILNHIPTSISVLLTHIVDTHTGFDYWIDHSRVVCNPRGYISRRTGVPENAAFDWMRVVEV